MHKIFFSFSLLFLVQIIFSCTGNTVNNQLKIYGPRELSASGDTIYYTVPEFSFVDQDSQTVHLETVKNKVFVVDFFFTTCPTICPRMKDQMLRVYEEFKGNNSVKIISHTIDPIHDTIPLLHNFAYHKLEIERGIWHFVTGEREKIYSMAEKYMVTAGEDGTEPGGFVHSGKFILVDQNLNIRGFYDGTDPLSVSDLMRDMKLLLNETSL